MAAATRQVRLLSRDEAMNYNFPPQVFSEPPRAMRETVGFTWWQHGEIELALAQMGFSAGSPLRVLAVELLPEPNGVISNPLGGHLDEVRILRTSPWWR